MKINIPRALTLAVVVQFALTCAIALAAWWYGEGIASTLSAISAAGVGDQTRQVLDAASHQVRVLGLVVLLCVLVGAGMAIALRRWLASKVTAPLDTLITALRAMAGGDLRQRIVITERTQAKLVFKALQQTHDGISGMAASVNSASQSINLAAKEISDGNHELSSRTERQASASAEIADTLHQLTETVRQNVEAANRMHQLSQDATEQVTRGAALTADAALAMQASVEQSARVREIVDVIDQLTFQTNLLALNASVEAARAGVHGVGFAVVASEVRALAKRSATAADQIRGVIGQSQAEVQKGASRVAVIGETVQSLVQTNRDMTTLSSEVAAASGQQRGAIERVREAMANIEDVAQRNAALAEQIAATSHELADQTSRLQTTASFWQLAASH